MNHQEMHNEIWDYLKERWSDGQDEKGHYYLRQRGFGSQVQDKHYLPTRIDVHDDGLRHAKHIGEGANGLYVCGFVALVRLSIPANSVELHEWREFREQFRAAWDKQQAALTYSTDYVDFDDVMEDLGLDPRRVAHCNTYNDTDSPLSGVFDYRVFECDGREWVFIQHHQGLDVRGGYSAYAILPYNRQDVPFPVVLPTISVPRAASLFEDEGYDDYDYPFGLLANVSSVVTVSIVGEGIDESHPDNQPRVEDVLVNGISANAYSGLD